MWAWLQTLWRWLPPHLRPLPDPHEIDCLVARTEEAHRRLLATLDATRHDLTAQEEDERRG